MERLIAAADKVPPHSIDAEQSALGSMMIEPSALEAGLERLQVEDFYRPNHQYIFDALASLSARDEPVDLITLQEELRRRSKLEECGGTEYLMALAEKVPTAANIDYYARIVEEKAILRRLIAAGTEIVGIASSEEDDVDKITDRAEQLVFQVGQRRTGKHFTPVTNLLHESWDWISARYQDRGQACGVTTGFVDLDYMTSGLQPSDLIIIAGRPSMGKTALALNIGVNAAVKGGHPVAVFSLEMSSQQLVHRMLCSLARVNAHRLRTGSFQDEEWQRLANAAEKMWNAPIYIDDTTDITVLGMRGKCRRLKAQHGLGLVVIDYLQLMRAQRSSDSRQQEISEIARSLKGLARELQVPVIALSQLSRAVERREDKRPMLSDLRESGSIEAEADLVMMLYRQKYYEHKEAASADDRESGGSGGRYDRREVQETEVIVAKHRNGPTGVVKLGFVEEFASFENYEKKDEYEG